MNCEFGMIENVKIFIIEIPQISSYIVYIWLSIAACNQDILVFWEHPNAYVLDLGTH